MIKRAVPTIRDVARLAGVSPATVSNVLGQRKPVDPALVERVRRASAELGYRVHRAASQLRSGRAKVVAALVPSLENPFFTSLIAALERYAGAEGYEIIVGSSCEQEEVEDSRLAALLSWRPAGVIIVPCRDAFRSRRLLAAERVPFVVVDRVADDALDDCVTIDNAAAGASAAEHLVASGHRDILVAASTLALTNIRERCGAIAQVVVRVPGGRIEVLELGSGFDIAAERMRARMHSGPLPGAAIAVSNYTTLALLAAFARFGTRVPDDISLIGFDDYAWMQAYRPPITAVRQPIDAMAAQAWRWLAERIQGSAAPRRRSQLGTELEIRQSTRAAGMASDREAAAPVRKRERAHGN
jgi:LacI family transcriptional regulator, galactose operon repressor